ncbi:MAG: HAMP domain-containing histidine kinase [Rubrobacter sp.]|nr:HAMP domain-containing histidine kinase [Rubrobacter sp.]
MSIRWRLTLFNALIMGAILLVVGFFLFFLLREALLSGVKDAAESRAIELAQDMEEEPGEELLDEEEAAELALQEVFALVRDSEGRVIAQTVPFEDGEGVSDPIWREALDSGQSTGGSAELIERGVSDYVYAVPINPSQGPARVVEVGKSYEYAEQAIETLTRVLVGGALVAFLLSVGAAYLLARAALSPVEAVVDSAREITEGDLSKRLPVAHKGDEIGRLATTINGLLAHLEAAFARREEALARQRRFTANASHELRTPLTSISGYAQLLEEWGLRDPRVARESVAAIRRESGYVRELVETLLALARGDEGAPLDPEPCNLGAVAEEAVQSARATAKDKVEIRYAQEPPASHQEPPASRRGVVLCDRGRVRQAVSILLDNAVKYTPKGGRVSVAVYESEEWAKIEVADTGIGIAEDQLPLIFERFHRADKARASSGAGLGLAIARQIAEVHGGTVEAKSSLGEGSTFTLSIPKKIPPPEDSTTSRDPANRQE